MVSQSLKILYVAMWGIATVLSFMLVSARDSAAPLLSSATVTATSWSGSESLATFRKSLRAYAHDNHLTLGQEVADFQKRDSVRRIYLLADDPNVPVAQRWLTRGELDGFGGSVTTKVHPFNEFASTSPLGAYEVFGNQVRAQQLQVFFAQHGMNSSVDPIGRLGAVPRSIQLTGAVSALLSTSLTGAFVVSRTRRYAIERLHGLSWWSIFSADATPAIRTWGICGLATLAIAGITARHAYGNTGAVLFTETSALIASAFLLVALLAHAIVLAMVAAVEILPALNGSLPSGALTFTAYGMRLAAVVVALGTMTTTLSLASDVVARNRTQHMFDHAGNISSITLGNAYSPGDQKKLDDTVGPWLRDLDKDHQLVLVAQQVSSSPDPRWRASPILFVNDNFLLGQPVHLKGGSILRASAVGSIRVALPSNHWSDRSKLSPYLGLAEQLRGSKLPKIEWVQAQAGQRYATFTPTPVTAEVNVNVWNITDSYAKDPIIIVMPSRFGWLSNGSYAAMASQGGVFFSNPVNATEEVQSSPRLERFVRGISPVNARAAALLKDQATDLRIAAFTAALAVAMVLMTGVAAAVIHTRRRAQSAFVRHLHGWSFATMYTAILAIEVCVSLVLVAWIPWRVTSARREYDKWASVGATIPVPPPVVTPAQWASMALIAGLALGGFCAALAMAHRQVIRGGVSQA